MVDLKNRRGDIVGSSVTDPADAHFNDYKWHRHGRYAARMDGARLVLLHREIMGEPPFEGAEVDHVNGDGLDNRRSNLRWVNRQQNLQNKRVYKNSRSGARGVWRDGGGFRARVMSAGRAVLSRRFKTMDEAISAAVAARATFLPYSNELQGN